MWAARSLGFMEEACKHPSLQGSSVWIRWVGCWLPQMIGWVQGRGGSAPFEAGVKKMASHTLDTLPRLLGLSSSLTSGAVG